MLGRPSRWAAVGLFALAVAVAIAGAGQVSLARTDGMSPVFRRCGGLMLVAAGLLFGGASLRLALGRAQSQGFLPLFRTRFWGWMCVGGVLISLVLGFAFTGEDGARFVCRGGWLLWAGVLVSVSCWPDTWRRRGPAWLDSRWGRRCELMAVNLVLTFLILETGLRALAAVGQGDRLLLNTITGYRMRPGVYPNGLRVNSLGFAGDEFRVEKPSGVVRVVALGDSFSVGAQVASVDNYLRRAEGQLSGVEVYNFGVCGTGPREYRTLLADVASAYRPDFVLVPVFVGNDVTETIAVPALDRFNPDALHVTWVGRRLFRLARERWRQSAESAESPYQMGIPAPRSEATYLEVTGREMVVCQVPEGAWGRQKWREALAELDGLFAWCRHHDVPAAMLVLPDAFQVDDDVRRRALARRGWCESDLDLLLPQRRLAAFCAERGVPCLDLYPALAPAGGSAYFPNDIHWNARGHHLAADAVAAWLRDRLPPAEHAERAAAKLDSGPVREPR